MGKYILNLLIFISLSCTVLAQDGFRKALGVKIGVNVARVTGGPDSIKYSAKNGLMAGLFFTPRSQGVLGYRSELIFSRQGFGYKTPGGRTGTLTNDYILLPQLVTVKISRYVQLQAGGQMGILLKSDDSNPPVTGGGSGNAADNALRFFNRIDWGLAGGVEFFPSKKLFMGGRFNLGLAKLNTSANNTNPSLPANYRPYNVDTKNSVMQFYLGLVL
jgi:hypothetical protein